MLLVPSHRRGPAGARSPLWHARGWFGGLLASALLLASLASAQAATRIVGPPGQGPGFAQVLREAQDGDLIDVLPGDYRGDVAVIHQRRLTVRGRSGPGGQRPVFHAAGQSAEGKAIWVIRQGEVLIENIEFRGARVADRNGAGLRFEKGRLTVRRCGFFDNENGILTANFGDAELVIEDSVFAQAPRVKDALHHLLYVGRIGKLSITGSRFHDGYHAHLIKSRAHESHIAYNLIVDGPTGEASYEIDLPNGGLARVIGNVIHQGAKTTNPVLVSYGSEGRAEAGGALLMAHNTLVSDANGAFFLRVWEDKLPPGVTVQVINNLSVGLGVLATGNPGRYAGNFPALASMLVDITGLAYGLKEGALLRGRGVSPQLEDGTDLAPRAEFSLPVGSRPLAPPAQWSPGAFQR